MGELRIEGLGFSAQASGDLAIYGLVGIACLVILVLALRTRV